MNEEKQKMAQLAVEFKGSVAKLEEKLLLQDKNVTTYRSRIVELEEHVKDLSKQLEKWAVMSIGKKLYQPSPSKQYDDAIRAAPIASLLPLNRTQTSPVEQSISQSISPIAHISHYNA